MVTSEPPVSSLSLAATAPTMNNGAILWGEAVTLTTTGPAGAVFQMQVTTDDPSAVTNPNWETLTDGSKTPPVPWSFTIPSSGSFSWDYRPIRNYWYRAIAGSTVSNTPRVTVRQTIAIRPQNSSTQTISRGRQITFSATVRPGPTRARQGGRRLPALPPVRQQLGPRPDHQPDHRQQRRGHLDMDRQPVRQLLHPGAGAADPGEREQLLDAEPVLQRAVAARRGPSRGRR